jgi:hypothetical protein
MSSATFRTERNPRRTSTYRDDIPRISVFYGIAIFMY